MAATICGFKRKVIGGVRMCTLPKGHRPPEHNEGLLVDGFDPRFVNEDASSTPREPKERQE